MPDKNLKTLRALGAPVARAAASLIPTIGGIAIEAISAASERIAQKRFDKLEEELHREGGAITADMLENDSIVHNIVTTVRAVARESQDNKIEYFARLLTQAGLTNVLGTDRFGEFLSILEGLSARELIVLRTLDEVERENGGHAGNPLQRATEYWPELRAKLLALGIPLDEQPGILSRLSRTGLYAEITGAYLGYGGGLGTLTSLWPKFRRYVIERDLDQRDALQAPR